MKFPSMWVDPGTTSSWLQSKEVFIHLIRHFSVPCYFISSPAVYFGKSINWVKIQMTKKFVGKYWFSFAYYCYSTLQNWIIDNWRVAVSCSNFNLILLVWTNASRARSKLSRPCVLLIIGFYSLSNINTNYAVALSQLVKPGAQKWGEGA